MQSLIARVDHLVFATPDVEQTIKNLALRLGVSSVAGGRHPQWGTHNALLSLGPRSYLEIMGPEPALSRYGLMRPFGIDRLQNACIATWVCKSEDLNKTVEIGREAGIALGNVQSGQRTKPDGTVLTWSMTDLHADREGGIVPFFIDWGSSRHPAEDAPVGCMLKELKAEHPNPDHIKAILKAFELDLPIQYGKVFRMKALIETRQGLIELV